MIDAKMILKLREMTGAGMNDCQKALTEANGDIEKAKEFLRKSGEVKAAKKMTERIAKEGIVYSYVHSNNKVGSMIELFCETDFVARTDDFKNLARDLAMQIVAMSPEYLSPEQVPAGAIDKEKEIYRAQLEKEGKPAEMIEKIMTGKLAKYYEEVCLLKQATIKDDKIKIEDMLKAMIAKTGEKIEIGKFIRFQI